MHFAVFSRKSDEWYTPEELYQQLDKEFRFVDDPCPIGGNVNGLMREWGSPCFVNPPYSDIGAWMEKALLEHGGGKTIVLLVPSRTDTGWWHNFAMKATEIRFVRKRLRFGGAKRGAPFPSAIVIFKADCHPRQASGMG